MAKKCTVTLAKKSSSAGKMKASVGQAAGDAFVFIDNEDSSCEVFGVDSQGHRADISAVATITAASSDDTVATVDPPEGTKFLMHGVKPGSTSIAVTATWNDGSIGPFSFDLPVDVKAGPVTGLIVVPGTPVVR